MSDDDKERTVEPGCGAWVFLIFLLVALWNIDSSLRKINQRLMMANCLTEAVHGVTCREAKLDKK